MFLLSVSGRVRVIALLAVVAWGFSASQAKAAFGIIITESTLMPVEDPLTQYQFKLALAANNQILQGDNISFYDLANFDGNARYDFVSGGVDFSQFFSIQTIQGSAAGLTNIALVLTASLVTFTNSTNGPQSIGTFIIETNVQYPPASGSPLFDPIRYTTQTHLFPSGALNLGEGTTTAGIVPEPCSLALLGVGVVPLLLTVRDRRRRALSSCAFG